jgi:hypothetical protein
MMRLLDVCSPDTPDEKCSFRIASLREDREDQGELPNFRDADVHLRGLRRRCMDAMGWCSVLHASSFQPESKTPAGVCGRSGEAVGCPSESATAWGTSGIDELRRIRKRNGNEGVNEQRSVGNKS